MKFLFGSQNFGLDMPGSDKDYVQFVYPAASALCGPVASPREVKMQDGSMIKYIDIRSVPNLFYKSNLDILQLLYSKEVYDGGEVEAYFRQYEEELSTINIPRLYKSVMGTALNRYKKETSKDLVHIVFGFKTLIQFEQQDFKDLRKCFEHDKRDLYQRIRTGKYEEWLPYTKELEKLACSKEDAYMRNVPNDEFKAKMDHDFGMMVANYLV